MSYGPGMNSNWVHARDPESAKAFARETQMQVERRQAAAQRSRERRDAVLRWLRSRLKRGR